MTFLQSLPSILIACLLAITLEWVARGRGRGRGRASRRYLALAGFALVPSVLAIAVSLSLEGCRGALSGDNCAGAGMLLMAIVAALPVWFVGLMAGWLFKDRRARLAAAD